MQVFNGFIYIYTVYTRQRKYKKLVKKKRIGKLKRRKLDRYPFIYSKSHQVERDKCFLFSSRYAKKRKDIMINIANNDASKTTEFLSP